jgi:hypothetical protein
LRIFDKNGFFPENQTKNNRVRMLIIFAFFLSLISGICKLNANFAGKSPCCLLNTRENLNMFHFAVTYAAKFAGKKICWLPIYYE